MTILLHHITNIVSCPHRKVYATLASAPGARAQVTAKVIQDTTPKNPDDYPTITYWHKRVQLDKKNRWLEFTKTKPGSKRKCKSKGKNIAFWHFQYSDSTVLNYDEVKAIRKDSKKIWRKMCNKHGPIGVPWTTISPDQHVMVLSGSPLTQR
jgi:hypothetical protein